jgi:hypothetical protein
VRTRHKTPPIEATHQIRKSSFLALLPLVAATIQRGMRPRPVQVFSGFLGSRYLTATLPLPLRPLAPARQVSLADNQEYSMSKVRHAAAMTTSSSAWPQRARSLAPNAVHIGRTLFP